MTSFSLDLSFSGFSCKFGAPRVIRAEHLAELAYPLLKHQLPQVPQRLQVAGDAKTETKLNYYHWKN